MHGLTYLIYRYVLTLDFLSLEDKVRFLALSVAKTVNCKLEIVSNVYSLIYFNDFNSFLMFCWKQKQN